MHSKVLSLSPKDSPPSEFESSKSFKTSYSQTLLNPNISKRPRKRKISVADLTRVLNEHMEATDAMAVTGTQTSFRGSITGIGVRYIKDNNIAGRLTLRDLRRAVDGREKIKRWVTVENEFPLIKEHIENLE